MISDVDTPVSFETHVKPSFRELDRRSMQSHFDLWSHDDVSQHADAILARLQSGTMPCDGAWPKAQVDLFQRWAESGKPSCCVSLTRRGDRRLLNTVEWSSQPNSDVEKATGTAPTSFADFARRTATAWVVDEA